ncbi:MAG: hypothetical protein LW710_05175 [Burkholderiales bacterium]|jgi:hypothetical protein|uniref:hypothetical protein n=1 Tax=Limnobacter sp. TaxID=2003368 RepID=UPI0039BC7533|nr:hypothetical protein [Burkholderiales bacterium]
MPANIQQLRTSLPSTNVWQNLNTQAAAATGAQNAHQTGNHELPGVHPSGQSWHAFTSSKNQHQPYVQHLNQSINGLHEFIHKHAASGPQKRKALTNVQNFSTTKINCKPAALTPMMVNENRRNLHLIAQQLKNDAIPLEQRVGLALALTEGLNVCNEGATLNIQSCASELINQQQGLAGIVVGLKNQLIDQQLLQLVKHVDARQLSPAMAEAFEIHHVQALKNHVAGQWGLTAIEDRYATDQYQHQVGPMAQALLEKTITPATLANLVADRIANKLVEFTSSELNAGMPSEQLKTEPLRRQLQAEFGTRIDLQHCLQFSEDYLTVTIQSREAIAAHVIDSFKNIGLVPKDASASFILSEKTISTQQAIEQTSHLLGAPPVRQMAFNASFWFGHTLNSSQQEKEDEERKKTQRHHTSA